MNRSNEVLLTGLVSLAARRDLQQFYARKVKAAESPMSDAVSLLYRLEEECFSARNFEGYRILRSARLQLLDLGESIYDGS